MPQTPIEILETAYGQAQKQALNDLVLALPDDCAQNLKLIIEKADAQKAVLGVVLTSLVHKIYEPSQDVRYHQDGMDQGYAGRTFDTKYITPFLQERFPHFAMAESAWLTRSLKQPHPYTFDYPGKIRNRLLKSAFLSILDQVETNAELAPQLLIALLGLMRQKSAIDENLFEKVQVPGRLTISRIIDAIVQHIYYRYQKGVVGTARLPVLAIYAVYQLILSDTNRYHGKTLAPLTAHTSSDSRSQSLGDIEILNPDGSCFEAIEIKHNKPITVGMVGVAYRKIKPTQLDRYYILTTNDPNFDDYPAIAQKIEAYKRVHPCQIVVNGVVPSLKYYLRLLSNPPGFIEAYTQQLQMEYQRASGIKGEHLQAWQNICRDALTLA
jgi:DNA (cytosine-5)-methyltransferase 1